MDYVKTPKFISSTHVITDAVMNIAVKQVAYIRK